MIRGLCVHPVINLKELRWIFTTAALSVEFLGGEKGGKEGFFVEICQECNLFLSRITPPLCYPIIIFSSPLSSTTTPLR